MNIADLKTYVSENDLTFGELHEMLDNEKLGQDRDGAVKVIEEAIAVLNNTEEQNNEANEVNKTEVGLGEYEMVVMVKGEKYADVHPDSVNRFLSEGWSAVDTEQSDEDL